MDKISSVFLLLLIAALAHAEPLLINAPMPPAELMGKFTKRITSFMCWMLGGAAAGSILARLLAGRLSRHTRSAIFSLSVLAGGALGAMVDLSS